MLIGHQGKVTTERARVLSERRGIAACVQAAVCATVSLKVIRAFPSADIYDETQSLKLAVCLAESARRDERLAACSSVHAEVRHSTTRDCALRRDTMRISMVVRSSPCGDAGAAGACEQGDLGVHAGGSPRRAAGRGPAGLPGRSHSLFAHHSQKLRLRASG